MRIEIIEDSIKAVSEVELPLLDTIPGVLIEEADQAFTYDFPKVPNNAFLLGLASRGRKPEMEAGVKEELKELLGKVTRPVASLTDDKKYINISIPLVHGYKELLKKVSAWPLGSRPGEYRLPISKFMTLDGLNNLLEDLPKIAYSEELEDFQHEPIEGFDGRIESLREISIGALNLIAANGQNRNALRKNSKTLEEKFEAQGIRTLHDLLFYFPRRYIDKTNPQSISDLLEGESATIVGKISEVIEMRNNMGLIFKVETEGGQTLRATFWRQSWLKQKFKPGDEVILTGKVTYWNGYKQLGGSSIDHADEAAILPIVPIYRQSEAKGITTYLVMAALRELLDRLGPVMLPRYFKTQTKENFGEILEEMHFPTSLDNRDGAMESFAYYELVYMQLLLEEERQQLGEIKGIPMDETPRNLQKIAINTLPYKLTNSQVEAIEKLNQSAAKDTPATNLLNAEVGSGKTIVAQLACLRAVDAGYQAVLIGPTEILAKQLYETFRKLVDALNNELDKPVRVEFLGGGMKAAEKKSILSGVKDGSIDILVGTHAVLGKTVKYANLGFVCIDEQQRFGAAQRTALLNSREDGTTPDLLMQTATPIPRTIAQIFYGDVEMLLLPERPPGRLPIETEWLEEDPQELIEVLNSPLWTDVIQEAEKGNQTFIITPLVQDSEKIDAASVEKTYELLRENALAGIPMGMVHGKMKKEEQAEVMEKFRKGDISVMVASTVIEVGVDVPAATRVVILSADRLGASSIWQIRGRVGRNSLHSKCYLVSLGNTDSSRTRLTSIVEAENGYDVAKADLNLRGEGTMFNSSQSGKSDMIVASLGTHSDLIAKAREEAKEIIESEHRNEALEDAYKKFQVEERLK